MEVLLVDRLQHHRDRTLEDLVLKRRYAERARAPVALRDVHATNGRCAVRTRTKASEQRLEVLLEIAPVLLRRLPVHTHRCVLTRAPVRFA
jgi:hypothetical protein